MYIVVFFLLIWSICYTVLSEARCKPNNHDTNLVYLLETNEVHREINKKFLEFYYKNTNIEMIQSISSLKNCSAILMETMEDVKILRYVIHLYVDGFYQTNYNTVIDNGLRWAGDIGKANYRQVCKSDVNFKRDDKETCTDYLEPQKHVKLVSEEIMSPNVYTSQEFNKLKLLMNSVKYFNILNILRNVDFPQRDIETIENIIVICGPVTQLENFNDTFKYSDKIIKISFSYDCYLRKGVVAILAPNPEAVKETSIPVIFYTEPYIQTDVSAFSNSIIRFRLMKYLAQAFMEFIKEMKLKRIAILSDDSEESVAFEKELRSLFNGEGISYIVVSALSVNNSCCDFTDAFDSLKQAEVKIAVANVDQKNADMMINHKSIYSKILWLARDWSPDTTTKALKRLKSIISVRPKRTPLKTYLQAVVNTIRIFYNNTYNDKYTLDYNDDFTLDYNNRKYFVHHLREEVKLEDETEIDVVLSRSGKESTVLNFKRGRSTVILHLAKLYDGNSDCSFKSANFYKPCDDYNLLLIMLVIAVFALTVLGIVYFFTASNTVYSRKI